MPPRRVPVRSNNKCDYENNYNILNYCSIYCISYIIIHFNISLRHTCVRLVNRYYSIGLDYIVTYVTVSTFWDS